MAALSDAQKRVLHTMIRHARCVGASSTDPEHGWVNVIAARSLVGLGFAREEVSAVGKFVFVLSAEGAEVAWRDCIEVAAAS